MSGRRLLLFACVLMGSGRTSVRVQPVDPAAQLRHVCIEETPKVIVSDFLSILRDGFARHGISTEVYSGEAPGRCEFVLTYTALQSWDFAPYLSYAELGLQSKGRQVAYAEYHLVGKGGFSLMKWQAPRKKMDPVIDELLKAYDRPQLPIGFEHGTRSDRGNAAVDTDDAGRTSAGADSPQRPLGRMPHAATRGSNA